MPPEQPLSSFQSVPWVWCFSETYCSCSPPPNSDRDRETSERDRGILTWITVSRGYKLWVLKRQEIASEWQSWIHDLGPLLIYFSLRRAKSPRMSPATLEKHLHECARLGTQSTTSVIFHDWSFVMLHRGDNSHNAKQTFGNKKAQTA